jgi:hypothetical protein
MHRSSSHIATTAIDPMQLRTTPRQKFSMS